jgi:hypothetical protein
VSRLRACKKPSLATQGELEPFSSSDLSPQRLIVRLLVPCLRCRKLACSTPLTTGKRWETLADWTPRTLDEI